MNFVDKLNYLHMTLFVEFFWEGADLYPGAGFKEKNHIQIAIINPNCIKGFFLPRQSDSKYPIP